MKDVTTPTASTATTPAASPAAASVPPPAAVTAATPAPAATAAPREHKAKTVASVTKTIMRNLDGLSLVEQRRVLQAAGMILGTDG